MHVHENSTAGLLLSLTANLPDPSCPIGRRARRIAKRLANATNPNRALAHSAADILARLIDAEAASMPWDDDGLLCAEFDE